MAIEIVINQDKTSLGGQSGMRTISIRLILGILAGIVAIPIIVFAIFLYLQLVRSDQAALERRTLREADAIASAVDLVLRDMRSTVALLSSAPELADARFSEFHFRSRLALEETGKFAIVVDEHGEQLLNTRVQFGEPLGKTSDIASLQNAYETGELVVSDVFFGETIGRHVVNVVQPLPAWEQSSARALIITKNTSDLIQALGSQDLPSRWNTAIVDGSGRVVAASGALKLQIGETMPAIFESIGGEYRGLIRNPNAGIVGGYSLVPRTSWYALKWGPPATARASILTNWGVLVTGGLILLGFLASGLIFFSERLRFDVVRLAVMAKKVGDGQVVSPERSFIREIDTVATALTDASFERDRAETQSRIVAGELAHRTKNLMAIVLSMVRQTARHSGSVNEMEKALSSRVIALGKSLDLLSRGAVGQATFQEVVDAQLGGVEGASRSIKMTGPSITLSPDAAQQLGMAIHELYTNASKHGALSSSNGAIHLEWTINSMQGEEILTIRWSESGGPPVSSPSRQGFGQTIIKDHLEVATGGLVQLEYGAAGFSWTYTVPLSRVSSKAQPTIQSMPPSFS